MTIQQIRQLLEFLDMKLFVDWEVAESSPEKIEGKLEFFTLGRYVSNEELIKEYENRNLVPADLYTLCEYAKKNPDFADKEHIGTIWKNKDDKWCFAAFDRWHVERHVRVYRFGNDWGDGWWFAGLRKYGTKNLESLGNSDSLNLDGEIMEIKKKKYKLVEQK